VRRSEGLIIPEITRFSLKSKNNSFAPKPRSDRDIQVFMFCSFILNILVPFFFFLKKKKKERERNIIGFITCLFFLKGDIDIRIFIFHYTNIFLQSYSLHSI
jgi:hypothetical protein